jgi:hypothetical protein
MEVLLPAIILEDEEDDLLIYCMSEDATDIFGKRKDGGYYYSLLGRYMMDIDMKFGEFFRVSRDIFHIILTEIKEDVTTRSCNRWQTPISAEQKPCLTLRYVGKQAAIFNLVLLFIQHQTPETRPQLQTLRKKRPWTPQETMAMRRCRNRSNDLIHGGR